MNKVLIAAIAASLMSGAAQAGGWSTSRTINHAELDLTVRAGAEAMARRIDEAAYYVCGGREKFRYLRNKAAHDACVNDATAKALIDLDAPLVTALYQDRVEIFDIARN
ncbi:MAG: UrcA family protein [Parvularculaceae bacterium]